MPTREELYKAAKMLKDYCASDVPDCDDCPFGGDCTNQLGRLPESWKLKKPRRWTDADILMAKALKAFGFEAIRKESTLYCTARYPDGKLDTLPNGIFSAAKYGEIVYLDDIIKEGEQ